MFQGEWEKESKPPIGWPWKGEVTFSDYMTRYRDGLDLVLRGVSFTISAGEKVSY